jgi:hypothetical protein
MMTSGTRLDALDHYRVNPTLMATSGQRPIRAPAHDIHQANRGNALGARAAVHGSLPGNAAVPLGWRMIESPDYVATNRAY